MVVLGNGASEVPPTAHSLLNPRARPPTSPAGFACRNPCALDRAQEARPVRLALMGGGVRAHCVSLQPGASQGHCRGRKAPRSAGRQKPDPLPFRRACDRGSRWRGRLFSRDMTGGSEGACTRPRCRLGCLCRRWRGRAWETRVSRPARHLSILQLCRLATSETPLYRSEVRILTPQIIHVHSNRKRSRRAILSSAALRTRASWSARSGLAARKRSSRAVSTSAEGGTRSLATRAAAAFGRAVQ